MTKQRKSLLNKESYREAARLDEILNSPDASPEEMPHSNVFDMWCWAQSHTRRSPQPAVRRAGGFAGKARLD